ncbi:AAA family ATPase [Phenylobacterium sp.]|uniref:AAA family ATPase n=1 Tax=Phenylobacterium sp. TaxID=1871053 RepID=UPI0035B28494
MVSIPAWRPGRECGNPEESADLECQTPSEPLIESKELLDGLSNPSPLDRPLGLTRFTSRAAREKRKFRVSLRNLAPKIKARTADRKERLPWLKLATFGDTATPKGSLRSDRNVRTIDGIEADYDGERITVAQAIRKLRKANLAALVYTSPSHTADAPRWRVLCPASKSLPPAERRKLVARLNGVFGGELALESFTLSQAYYYGSVGYNPAHTVELVDGRYIDQAAELPEVGPPSATTEHEPGDIANDHSAEDPEKLRSALEAISGEWLDRYQPWLRVGMALHAATHGDDEGRELWDEFSRRSDHYDPDEIAEKWESFSRDRPGGVGAGTIYREAKAQGWRGLSLVKSSGRLTFLTPEECAAAPSRGYIIKGLLAPRDVACIFGPPGAGKSTVAPFLGYMVAQGEPAFALRTRQGGVFYVAAEDGHGLAKRVQALSLSHGDAPGFLVVQGVSDLHSEDSGDLDELRAAVAERKPALIVIDTLAAAFPGLEENQSDSMARVVSVARELTEHGAAVVLIHHGTKAEGTTPRGHSVLNGALDVALQVEAADTEGIVRGRLTKNRNGPPTIDIAFRIESCVLGEDEDGDAITAALVDALRPGLAREHPKLTAHETEALDVLREEIGLKATVRPNGERAVMEAEWRKECRNERVCAGGTYEARKKAVKRAADALIAKGVVSVKDGWAWISEAGDSGVEWPDYTEEDAE